MKTKLILLSLLLPLIAVTMGSSEEITISSTMPTGIIRVRKTAIGETFVRPASLPNSDIPASSLMVEGSLLCRGGWDRSLFDFEGRLYADAANNTVILTAYPVGGSGRTGPVDKIYIGSSATNPIYTNFRYPGYVIVAGKSTIGGNLHYGHTPGLISGKLTYRTGRMRVIQSLDTAPNFMITIDIGEFHPESPGSGWLPIDAIYIGGANIQYLTIDATNFITPSVAMSLSDITLKKDIVTIPDALDKVCRLRGVNFRWKDKKRPSLKMGLIGQEVERVFPEVVDTDKRGIKSVQYSALVAALVEATKEQQKEIADLKKKLELIESNKNNPKKAVR